MSAVALFVCFLMLPFTLIIGSLSGIGVGAALSLSHGVLLGISHDAWLAVLPPTLAGAVAGALPVFVSYIFYRHARFWEIGALLIVMFLFFVLLPPVFSPTGSITPLVHSLAMEVPGFIFGVLMAASFTNYRERVERWMLRLLLVLALAAWAASGAPYPWSLAPLKPIPANATKENPQDWKKKFEKSAPVAL